MYNVLKTVYASNEMYKVFNRNRIGLAKVARRKQHVAEGLSFKYNVHTGGSSAGGMIGEGTALPSIDTQKNAWQDFNMKTYAHQLKMTGQLIHSTEGKKAAMAAAWDFAARTALQDAMDDFNVMLYRPANGLLTPIKSAPSTTTFTVENPRRLRVGQTISIGLRNDDTYHDADLTDESVGTNGTAQAITAISSSSMGATITVGSALTGWTWTAATAAAGVDQFGNSVYGVYDDSVYDTTNGALLGTFGLEDMIAAYTFRHADAATGTDYDFGGVDREAAGNAWSKGNIHNANGGFIDHGVADQAADLVSISGPGEVKFWLGSPEMYREVKRLHIGDKRATMREQVGDGWFSTAELANRPFYPCKHCGLRDVYGIDNDYIWFAENKPLDWERRDGNWMHRQESYWGYQALMTRMWQLCGIPSCHVRITNLNFEYYNA